MRTPLTERPATEPKRFIHLAESAHYTFGFVHFLVSWISRQMQLTNMQAARPMFSDAMKSLVRLNTPVANNAVPRMQAIGFMLSKAKQSRILLDGQRPQVQVKNLLGIDDPGLGGLLWDAAHLGDALANFLHAP